MPKRKNPFGETVPVQLKTHVSAKHVATKEDMEEIYRKTRERLLGLEKVGKGASNCVTVDQENGIQIEKCRCCNNWLPACGVLCSYCKFQVCSNLCLRECCKCGQSFCLYCTVLNYDQSEVRTFCLDCLSSFSL